MDEDSRTAHIVLTTPDGVVLGRLEPIEVRDPWWPIVAPIVEAVRERDGLEIVVLRLLGADRPYPEGGDVTYLAEVAEACATRPWPGTLDDDPRRVAYARPGGPAADLSWAMAAMAANGIAAVAPPEQIKTWNLSSLWRLPSSEGTLWLKVVPPFFAQESRLLGKLAAHPAPRLLARDDARMLMRELPGKHVFRANRRLHIAAVKLLVRLQADFVGRDDELLGVGLPDWRAIAAVVERAGGCLPAVDRMALDRFVSGLADRFAALDACGVPATLVHGDFHPGNCIGDADGLALLDFTDSVVGHPLLDMPTYLPQLPDAMRPAVHAAWMAAWRAAAAGSDPDRAAALVAPIASARQAAVYQAFLDAIEPSERVYHAVEPPSWLERTVRLLRRERSDAAR